MKEIIEVSSRHLGLCKISKDVCIYNGFEIDWFIGDVNFERALKLGCANQSDTKFPNGQIISNGTIAITKQDGAYWEAWGSCNGHAYQLSAWYNRITMELIDIKVLPPKYTYMNADGIMEEKDAYYFHEETYKLLTKQYDDEK